MKPKVGSLYLIGWKSKTETEKYIHKKNIRKRKEEENIAVINLVERYAQDR